MNLSKYTEEMRKSMWDKSFFMDKIIGAKCVIDFGCADASMICMLSEIFPSIDFFGYDNNPELVKMARNNLDTAPANCCVIYDDKELSYLIGRIKRNYKPEEICINFSSVLHEVFSCSPSGKAAIKTLISELNPKYITIRDMYYHESKTDNLMYVNESYTDETMLKYMKDFEAIYGPITNMKNYLHFLMKYQWKDNDWQAELNENYFSWTLDNLKTLFGPEYAIIFRNHYQLPYLTELWSDMFFNPNLQTHVQLIFRRTE